MAGTDLWQTIFAERRALASDLASLGDDGWRTPSLCEAWTVRDVLAHMTATAKMTPPLFFAKMLGNGFSFTRMQAKDIAANAGAAPADTLSGFAAVTESTKRPPGPADTMLGETLIHGEDIRRALGISRAYPEASLIQVADFFKGSNLIIGTKRRIEGLSLRATDAGWSHGTGPEVTGPMLAIVMAMTGRKQALSDLSGDGVETLRGRP